MPLKMGKLVWKKVQFINAPFIIGLGKLKINFPEL